MSFYKDYGDYEDFRVIEKDDEHLQKYMLNNTPFRENSWFWWKTEIVLILKLIPNTYYQILSAKLVLRGIPENSYPRFS